MSADDGVSVGTYVRVLSLPEDGFEYLEYETLIRKSVIGGVCRVIGIDEGRSTATSTGTEFLLCYQFLTKSGVASYGLRVADEDIEPVEASEELLLLHSEDLWQLIRPYGEHQDTATFRRLRGAFGLVELSDLDGK
ncbi:MAG: hypothetical protein J0H53_14835 [Rhizobiales bacterium]|nr:hypothetical protein [Hyphomicrobiales bacterium]OJU31044.1 MAG: hypothetical protein BGN94_06580 [Rhizobiales bacterium 68-8]